MTNVIISSIEDKDNTSVTFHHINVPEEGEEFLQEENFDDSPQL